MSGPTRHDGADELGLAEVAWQLRSTLSDAGDVPIHGDDAVLSTIRRRSTKKRRTKRVLSTSVAAFALSLSTLAVVKGGQVAIDHNLARRDESPAVTPGNTGSEDEDGASEPDPTTNGTTAPKGRPTPNDCRPDPHNGVVSCQPNSAGTRESTIPGQGVNGDPTSTAPDGPRGVPGPGPASTVAPTTTEPPPPPTTRKPTPTFDCGMISPAAVPTDPQCFRRHFDADERTSLRVDVPDLAAPDGITTWGWRFRPEDNFVILAIEDPVSAFRPVYWQCPEPKYTGVAPEWYALAPECIKLPGPPS